MRLAVIVQNRPTHWYCPVRQVLQYQHCRRLYLFGRFCKQGLSKARLIIPVLVTSSYLHTSLCMFFEGCNALRYSACLTGQPVENGTSGRRLKLAANLMAILFPSCMPEGPASSEFNFARILARAIIFALQMASTHTALKLKEPWQYHFQGRLSD